MSEYTLYLLSCISAHNSFYCTHDGLGPGAVPDSGLSLGSAPDTGLSSGVQQTLVSVLGVYIHHPVVAHWGVCPLGTLTSCVMEHWWSVFMLVVVIIPEEGILWCVMFQWIMKWWILSLCRDGMKARWWLQWMYYTVITRLGIGFTHF